MRVALDKSPCIEVLDVQDVVWSSGISPAELADAFEQARELVDTLGTPRRASASMEDVTKGAQEIFRRMGLGPFDVTHGGFQWQEFGIPRITELFAQAVLAVSDIDMGLALAEMIRSKPQGSPWRFWKDGDWLVFVAAVMLTVPNEAFGYYTGLPGFGDKLEHVSPFLWLVAAAEDLESLGVERNDCQSLRQAATGRDRPMSRRWLPSIGLWGCVASLNVVKARVAQATTHQVNSYRQKWQLETAGTAGHRTQAQLAYEAGHRQRSARELGITEFERLEYSRRWLILYGILADDFGLDDSDWADIAREAEQAWERWDLELKAPPELLA